MRSAVSADSAFRTTFEELSDDRGVKLLGIFVDGFIAVETAGASLRG